MITIEELVKELNDLCKQYLTEKERFTGRDRLQQVFQEIKSRGYTIASPLFSEEMPEYDLLSEEGRKTCDRMNAIRKAKLEAIAAQEYERAADLRDEERKLLAKIRLDFTSTIKDQHFIVAGKCSDLVLFNDPENFLIALLKG
jgi:hypothetical protein